MQTYGSFPIHHRTLATISHLLFLPSVTEEYRALSDCKISVCPYRLKRDTVSPFFFSLAITIFPSRSPRSMREESTATIYPLQMVGSIERPCTRRQRVEEGWGHQSFGATIVLSTVAPWRNGMSSPLSP